MDLCVKTFLLLFIVTETTQRHVHIESDYFELLERPAPKTNCTKCESRLLRYYEAKGCRASEYDACECPIKFDCPNLNEIVQDIGVCSFNGTLYNIGKSLTIKSGKSGCLECSCHRPPELACVSPSCPPNPSEANCIPYQADDRCCPQYDCLYGDGNSRREVETENGGIPNPHVEDLCDEIECVGEKLCLLYRVMCGNDTCEVPTCMESNFSCPTPLCDAGCFVVEQDSNKCPTCVCDKDNMMSSIKCHMPECNGEDCQFTAGDDGCPTCSCNSPCVECPSHCNVLADLNSNCPRCVCEDESGCPTPICENDSCRIENGPSGCPTCICTSTIAIETSGSETEGTESLPQTSTQQRTGGEREGPEREGVKPISQGAITQQQTTFEEGDFPTGSSESEEYSTLQIMSGTQEASTMEKYTSGSTVYREPIRDKYVQSAVEGNTNQNRQRAMQHPFQRRIRDI